jgi:hypothetical protein
MNRKLTNLLAIVITVTCIASLVAACNNPADDVQTPAPQGEIKTYAYQNFEFEMTNVKAEATEIIADDAGNDWQYTVITYYPGAQLTVINADMSDPAYAADGQAHPQWGILLDPADPTKRIEITDVMQPLTITADMRGIYNLEASLYIFKFEAYSE